MRLNYVIWSEKIVPNACTLGSMEGVEDEWELNEGVPRAHNFTEHVIFRMDPDFPYDTLLVDNLCNSDMLIVASQRLKEFLEKQKVEHVEFLPVTILDHKGKRVPDDYFIIHPIDPVECLDIDNCGVTWDKLDEGSIDYVRRLVIDNSMINKDNKTIEVERKLFRPNHYYRVALIRRDLSEAIEAKGFTGVEWIELDKYSDWD